MHEPVSTPYPKRGGVRSSGRAPAPPLSAEAAAMIATLPTDPDRLQSVLGQFVQGITETPSRAGAEALAFFAASYREAGRSDAEQTFTVLSANVTASCDREAFVTKMKNTALALGEASRAAGYAAGFEAGQASVKAQLPAVLRETTFITDELGHIVGKTEKEFKPGG